MLGLIVLFVIGVYLAVSALVVWLASRWAKKHKRRGWVWGGVAAFTMYNLVFWDLIPTLVIHKYYCATEAGFWVYKTPDQWIRENPGVMGTLVASKGALSTRVGDMNNFTDTYVTNDRFRWTVRRTGPDFPNLWRHEQAFIDVKTNEVLARYKDFSTSQIAPQAGWAGWKFWLQCDHCEGGETNQGLFWQIEDALRGKDEK